MFMYGTPESIEGIWNGIGCHTNLKSLLLGYGGRKLLIDMCHFLMSNWCQGY